MRLILHALIVSLLACSTANSQQPAAWAEKLFDGKVNHDFGSVNRGDKLKYSFTLTNIYKVPLEITQIRMSCDCIKATASKRSLESKDTGTIDVVVDTEKFTGPHTVKVYVTVGPTFVSTAVLYVSMNPRGDIVTTPSTLDFGNVRKGQTPMKQFDLEYVGSSKTWKVNEILNSTNAPYELKADFLPPGADGKARQGLRLTATMKKDAPVGAFKHNVTIKTNDRALGEFVYKVFGTVQDRLTVSPDPVAMNGKVGEELSKKVVLRSDTPFRVTSIEGLGDGLNIDLPKTQQASHVLTVALTAAKAGPFRRQLTIVTDQDKESVQLTVEGTIEK